MYKFKNFYTVTQYEHICIQFLKINAYIVIIIRWIFSVLADLYMYIRLADVCGPMSDTRPRYVQQIRVWGINISYAYQKHTQSNLEINNVAFCKFQLLPTGRNFAQNGNQVYFCFWLPQKAATKCSFNECAWQVRRDMGKEERSGVERRGRGGYVPGSQLQLAMAKALPQSVETRLGPSQEKAFYS